MPLSANVRTSGIGRATAEVLAQAGAHVVISSRKPEDCERVAKELREKGLSAEAHACHIGNRVLIGMGSLVLDKAQIEDEVFIAAGSLVSPGKRLKSGWLYRGQPAQPVRELTAAELANLKYSAEHYVRVKNRYLEPGL